MNNQIVQKVINKNKPKIYYFKNLLWAFLIGGLIGLSGEILFKIFHTILKLSKENSLSLMSMSLIIISSILTGFGIYDKIGQVAGAGTILPITGFSNSMTSAALESKTEGLIQGIFANMLKLAGTVIISGSLVAFVVSFLIYLSEKL